MSRKDKLEDFKWFFKGWGLIIGDKLQELFLYPKQHIRAKKAYSEIEEYHSEIIELYNDLFGIELDFPTLRFGGKGGSYHSRKDKIRIGEGSEAKKNRGIGILEDTLDTLCEEEAHRYHGHANQHSPYNLNLPYFLPEEYHNYGICWSTFAEGVARSAKVKIFEEFSNLKTKGFQELGFDNLYELWEPLSHKIVPVEGKPSCLDPDDVFSYLRNKNEDYFKEFIRKDPSEAIETVYPNLSDMEKDLAGLAIKYP